MNFTQGPFDKYTTDNDYGVAEAIEKFYNEVDADIYLMSHSNGFPLPPAKFKHSRKDPIMKQLQNVLEKRQCKKYPFARSDL